MERIASIRRPVTPRRRLDIISASRNKIVRVTNAYRLSWNRGSMSHPNSDGVLMVKPCAAAVVGGAVDQHVTHRGAEGQSGDGQRRPPGAQRGDPHQQAADPAIAAPNTIATMKGT